jgi:hypothetical protein
MASGAERCPCAVLHYCYRFVFYECAKNLGFPIREMCLIGINLPDKSWDFAHLSIASMPARKTRKEALGDGRYILRIVSATKAISFYGHPTHEERAEAAAIFCDSNTEVHEIVNGTFPLYAFLDVDAPNDELHVNVIAEATAAFARAIEEETSQRATFSTFQYMIDSKISAHIHSNVLVANGAANKRVAKRTAELMSDVTAGSIDAIGNTLPKGWRRIAHSDW